MQMFHFVYEFRDSEQLLKVMLALYEYHC